MKQYSITVSELKALQNLINKGYEIYEINIHRGISEIKLKPSNNDRHIETIILVAI